MDLQLISDDHDLCRLCRATIAEVVDRGWGLSAVSARDASDAADLWLWDYHPELDLPAAVESNPSKHLFLVHRRDLAGFRSKTGVTDVHVLLKPVTRATLAAFLGSAIAMGEDRPSVAHTLRDDRDEILQCLIQANLKLQEYDQDRTTFLARAVHDFRAPLTAVSGYCGLLLAEPLGPLTESQKEVLRRMLHSTKRLSRMAAAMFQLSVGRHVEHRPELKRGDIRECVEQALHEIAPFADDKSIGVTVDLAAPKQPLLFETGQIEQALVNILDNACKFTQRGGTIEVRGYPYFWERRRSSTTIPAAAERRRRSELDATAYRIDVRDSGNAIPAERLPHIFEEYTSFMSGRDRSGGGLGLAITRMIVNQHEGNIWAENTESGPMFTIVLPLLCPPDAAAVVLESVSRSA